MTEKHDTTHLDTNNVEFDVPSDFPRHSRCAVVGGFQDKLVLSRHGGRFFAPGTTPPEVCARWEKCEVIAAHLAEKSIECKAGKRAHMSEADILEQYLSRLQKTGWVSDDEALWVIRRTAAIIGWAPPPNALPTL